MVFGPGWPPCPGRLLHAECQFSVRVAWSDHEHASVATGALAVRLLHSRRGLRPRRGGRRRRRRLPLRGARCFLRGRKRGTPPGKRAFREARFQGREVAASPKVDETYGVARGASGGGLQVGSPSHSQAHGLSDWPILHAAHAGRGRVTGNGPRDSQGKLCQGERIPGRLERTSS